MEKTEMSLKDARDAAGKVYEQLIANERTLLSQLDELRAQRYRQEGYLAALDQILGAQENGNGNYQEEGTSEGQMGAPMGQEGREEGREEVAPA